MNVYKKIYTDWETIHLGNNKWRKTKVIEKRAFVVVTWWVWLTSKERRKCNVVFFQHLAITLSLCKSWKHEIWKNKKYIFIFSKTKTGVAYTSFCMYQKMAEEEGAQQNLHRQYFVDDSILFVFSLFLLQRFN